MVAQAIAPPPKKLALPAGNDYAAIWNGLKPFERKKLMTDAGYPSNHWNQRAWLGIPYPIRVDLTAVIKRYQRASTPRPAAPASDSSAQPARKPFWWEKEGGADE